MTAPEVGVRVLRALWICNRRSAPESFDPQDMNGGTAPMLTKENLSPIEEFLGSKHENYFAIDGGHFPLKALAQGRKNGVIYDITLGVSQFAMPRSEIVFRNNYLDCNRIELGFATQEQHGPLARLMASVISDVANMPWIEHDILWHSHTFDSPNIKDFSQILLINPVYVKGLEHPQWRNFMGNRINLLWLVPITAEELSFLREKGIAELISICPEPQKLHIFDGKPKFILR